MNRKLFLHVGAGKTGTTAIQTFMKENRERLQAHGIKIPEQGLILGNAIAHHGLSNTGPSASPNNLQLWQDIASLKDQKVLVSSEIFHSMIKYGKGQEQFEQIAEAFRDWDVQVIFYIRRQSQWIQSAYQQWVKQAKLTASLEDTAAKHNKHPLSKQVFQFAQIFGDAAIRVRPFERAQFEGGDLLRDFFHILGLELDESFVRPTGNPNPRLSLDALEYSRLVNYFYDGPADKPVMARLLRDYSMAAAKDTAAKIHTNHSLMSPTLERKIERENEKYYQEIAKRFLGREHGKLFLTPLPERENDVPQESTRKNSLYDRIHAFVALQLVKENTRLKEQNRRLSKRLDAIEKILESDLVQK